VRELLTTDSVFNGSLMLRWNSGIGNLITQLSADSFV